MGGHRPTAARLGTQMLFVPLAGGQRAACDGSVQRSRSGSRRSRSAASWTDRATGAQAHRRCERSSHGDRSLNMRSISLRGERALVTGGAGTIGSHIVDQLVEAGASEIVVLDNLVRGRRENLAEALASGSVRIVEGDIRDRELVQSLTQGIDVVFHQAAIRITQCAEEPRLALEVLVDGTFNVVEAAARDGRSQGCRGIVCLDLRARHAVPDHRGSPPVRQRHAVRRRQDLTTRDCCAAITR